MRLVGWLSLSIGFALAIGFPLVLLGAPKEAVWPIALAFGAILLVVRPGGTIERFMGGLFAYGLVFSVWCVAGVVVCILLALVFSGFRAPVPIYLILGFGLFGVIRELARLQVQPGFVSATEESRDGVVPIEVAPSPLPSNAQAPASVPASSSLPSLSFDNTKQRMEARARVRRELGE